MGFGIFKKEKRLNADILRHVTCTKDSEKLSFETKENAKDFLAECRQQIINFRSSGTYEIRKIEI